MNANPFDRDKQNLKFGFGPPAPVRIFQDRPGAKQSGPAGMIFVSIPAGSFMMGSPEDEEGRSSDETRHEVTLLQNFEIAETPVTQSQWKKLTGKNPSYFRLILGGGELPVEQVSWEDAVEFCTRLSNRDRNFDYALPTEAQWEYACRALATGPYKEDGDQLDSLGWFDGNSGNKTHPVKQKNPNAWNLFDTHGNVLEWCADWYQEDLGVGAVTDPTGPGNGGYRVMRGGSWDGPAQYCRSAYRGRVVPGTRFNHIGFRPVRIPKASTGYVV